MLVFEYGGVGGVGVVHVDSVVLGSSWDVAPVLLIRWTRDKAS